MNIITLLVLTLFSYQSFAAQDTEIQYVTGKLYLSLYQQADSGSKIIKSLVSGERLEVLEIAGPYANVVTDQGSKGWVKKGFMVKGKPAVILYKETDAALKLLKQQRAEDKQQYSTVDELKDQLASIAKENKELKKEAQVLFLKQQQLMSDRNETTDAFEISAKEYVNKTIELMVFKQFIEEYSLLIMASFLLFLLVGFRVGELKTESDVIKHFGGVKVW